MEQQPIQSREDWLVWRHAGIGSSDAPVIMGVSPWSTPLKLYDEKINPFKGEDTDNQYIKNRGNEIEPKVRALVELLKGTSFTPALCVLDGFPFLKASLDGRSPDKKTIIEIKLLGREDWDRAKGNHSDGPGAPLVPQKYMPQMQHQLMVSNAEVCLFAGYLYEGKERPKTLSMENLVIVPVYPSKDYIVGLMQEEIKFWDCVQKRKPPVATDKDYKPLVGIAPIAKKWLATKKKIDDLELMLEACRKDMIEAAERQGHARFLCAGVRLRQESRVGNVQYAKIPELKGVDLEKYRGNGSTYWKVEPMEKTVAKV